MDAKSTQRQLALNNRRALTGEERAEKSRLICERLLSEAKVYEAKLIFGYAATAEEAELSYLYKSLIERGANICFPRCEGKGRMKAYLPLDDGAWEIGPFGIAAPLISRSVLINPAELELVLVPCVAFDGKRNRLGWGGGYYDRYLTQCPRALKIAAAFEAQRLEHICLDAYDIAMDAIATEARWY